MVVDQLSWQWITIILLPGLIVKVIPRLNDYCYRLGNQRIPRLQGCLGELHWRSAAMSSWCPQPPLQFFESGSEAEMSTLVKYLNRDIHRNNRRVHTNALRCALGQFISNCMLWTNSHSLHSHFWLLEENSTTDVLLRRVIIWVFIARFMQSRIQ